MASGVVASSSTPEPYFIYGSVHASPAPGQRLNCRTRAKIKLMLVNKIKSLGNILGVWAHPDDESFLSAGLMAMAVKNGQTVACVTATKGEQGVQNEAKWPRAKLAEIRAKELDDCFAILGVKYHHWLDYPDGGCAKVNQDEAVQKVLDFIEKYQPNTVITFPPDGITGHDDHKSVSRWSRQAIKLSNKPITLLYGINTQEQYDKYFKIVDDKFNLYFNVDKPHLIPEKDCTIFLELPDDLCKVKKEVLAAQPSQTESMYEVFGEDFWLGALGSEAFITADSKNSADHPL